MGSTSARAAVVTEYRLPGTGPPLFSQRRRINFSNSGPKPVPLLCDVLGRATVGRASMERRRVIIPCHDVVVELKRHRKPVRLGQRRTRFPDRSRAEAETVRTLM